VHNAIGSLSGTGSVMFLCISLYENLHVNNYACLLSTSLFVWLVFFFQVLVVFKEVPNVLQFDLEGQNEMYTKLFL